jgi:tetratricopeptide (TPR) repeat protein
VETLLMQATEGEGILEGPVWQQLGMRAGRSLPEAIGRYRVLRLVGEGGMGTVYEAEQDHPRRVVALKVIKPGLTSRELLRRFERESQALGRLQHPGIAQIYEAGTADAGFGPQPYFAMEFILGETLKDYAASQSLDTRQRLELVAHICDALQHAHGRGLIHRDLKPANILVDRTGQPKILDFGVARLADEYAHGTLQTDAGQLVGTLAYMSPEQVAADPLELDTRSDVYALGVILYELLAGRLPYEIGNRVHEAVQTIRDEDPTRLSSVNRIYRGDIETIVGKALEKDKARRYTSAAALAEDIRRHLSDQPITARSASATYQLQKFARRHKTLVGGVAAVFVVLVAGIVVSTWQAQRATAAQRLAVAAEERVVRERDEVARERNRAVAAQEAAQRERNQAVAEKQRADTEADTARAVSEFLRRDLLAQASARAQASPDTKPDPDLKVRSALDRAAARIGSNFRDKPLVEAAIRQTIGSAYFDLGLYPQAREHMERAFELRKATLGENDPATTEVLGNLASLSAQEGRYPEAEKLYSRTLESLRRLHGDEHPDVLAAMSDLAQLYQFQGRYAQAAALMAKELATERRVLGPDHPTTLSTMVHLADAYHLDDRDTDSQSVYRNALEAQRRVLGADHPDTFETMVGLANSYATQAKVAMAEPLFTEALNAQRRVLGPGHPETLITMADLALMYKNNGQPERAEPLYLDVLAGRRKLLGEEHPDTLIIMNNLGALYSLQRRFAEAEALFVKVLDARKRLLGLDHQYTLNTMTNLAQLYDRQGKGDEAERAYTEVLGLRQRVMGKEHADSRLIMNNLGLSYFRRGKLTEAESMFSSLLEIQRRRLGNDHPDTLKTADNLGLLYLEQQRYEDVELLLTGFVTPSRDAIDTWYRSNTVAILGAALTAEKKYAEAERLLTDGYQGLLARKATIPALTVDPVERARQWIVQLYEMWGKPDRAAEWRNRLSASP